MPEQRKRELCHFDKIGYHGKVPRDIGKWGLDRSSAPKTLSFGKKIAKIGPADPEIIVVREIIKRDKKRKKKEINASKISLVDNLAERAKIVHVAVLWCYRPTYIATIYNYATVYMVPGQNGDKPKRRKSKRRHQNGDKEQRTAKCSKEGC